jgi:hypothetical protein
VAIVAALRTLIDGAKAEGRPEYVHFAEKLMCACAHGGKGVLSDSAAPVTSRPPCLTRRSRPLDDVKPESARRPRWRESCAGGTCAREHERSQIDAFFLTIAQSYHGLILIVWDGALTPPANVGLSESLVLGSRTSSRMYQRSRSSRPQSQARR